MSVGVRAQPWALPFETLAIPSKSSLIVSRPQTMAAQEGKFAHTQHPEGLQIYQAHHEANATWDLE